MFIVFPALLLVLYLPSLSAPFTYDDVPMIQNNLLLKPQTSPLKLFTTFFHDSGKLLKGYRPITQISYNLNSRFLGEKPYHYRLINLLIHLVNSIMLIFFLRVFLRNRILTTNLSPKYEAIATFSGLIFLIHPIASNSINLIWKRSSLLAAFFYLTALLVFMIYLKNQAEGKGTEKKKYSLYYAIIIIGVFILGLLSKEEMITLPLILFLLDWTSYRGKYFWKNRIAKSWLLYMALGSLALSYYLFRVMLISNLTPVGYGIAMPSIRKYAANQLIAVVGYISLFFDPSRLNIDHYFPDSGLALKRIVCFSIITSLIIVSAWKLYRKKGEEGIGFSILSYFIILIPTSSVFSLVVYMDESRAYLPTAFLITCFAILFINAIRIELNLNKKFNKSWIIFAFCLAVVASWSTYTRNKVWKDPVLLWQDSVRKGPQNPRALNALGVSYKNASQYKEAIRILKMAISLDDKYYSPVSDLGLTYLSMGDFEKAESYLKRAESLLPIYPLSLYNMIALYSNEQFFNPEKLIYYYRKYQLIWGYRFDYSYKLGLLLNQAKRHPDAIRELKRAILLFPQTEGSFSQEDSIKLKFDIHYMLGSLYIKTRNYEEAISQYSECLKLIPDEPNALVNLGGSYFSKGDLNRCREIYERAYSLNPNNKLAAENLVILYKKLGQIEKLKELERNLQK
jgi:protein O-mannosyl-transferase